MRSILSCMSTGIRLISLISLLRLARLPPSRPRHQSRVIQKLLLTFNLRPRETKACHLMISMLKSRRTLRWTMTMTTPKLKKNRSKTKMSSSNKKKKMRKLFFKMTLRSSSNLHLSNLNIAKSLNSSESNR